MIAWSSILLVWTYSCVEPCSFRMVSSLFYFSQCVPQRDYVMKGLLPTQRALSHFSSSLPYEPDRKKLAELHNGRFKLWRTLPSVSCWLLTNVSAGSCILLCRKNASFLFRCGVTAYTLSMGYCLYGICVHVLCPVSSHLPKHACRWIGHAKLP